MSCDTYFSGDSFIHRLDPRIRVLTAFGFSAVMAVAQQRPVITADAFELRARDLQNRVRQAQLEAQAGNQQLKRALDQAMDKVQKELFHVVAELAEEAGAGVVLFRSSIVIAVKKLEISQEALKRLNAKISKVDVVFEPAKQ